MFFKLEPNNEKTYVPTVSCQDFYEAQEAAGNKNYSYGGDKSYKFSKNSVCADLTNFGLFGKNTY